MALEDIEVYVEVVKSRSFTRAAKSLGKPISTVSAKVARLEEQLGVTLLLRTTRQVSVTSEGEIYYNYCVRALAELSEAEQELAHGSKEPAGILHLTAPADLAQSVLAPVIETYFSRYPSVSVDLMVTNRKVDLAGEGVDLAVRVGDLADSGLIARKFLDTRAGLWASFDYLDRHGTPHTIKDLANHQMVQMKLAQRQLKLMDSNNVAVEYDFSSRLSTDDMQSCRMFIENGAGIGILPDFIGKIGARTGQLIRVLPELSSTSISTYFVYPEQRFLSQNVRTFIDCALERI